MREYTPKNRLFSEREKEKIENRVEKIESQTSGEIAVVVSDRSGRYREAEVLGGIFVSGLISLVLTWLFFHGSIWWFIPLAVVFYLPARALFSKMPALTKNLLSRERIEQKVRDRALTIFYEKGLHRTRDNTGVLIFISVMEKRVWILADRGIYEKIEQTTLDDFARLLSRGIKEGRSCDALCETIEGIGKILSMYFPIKHDDSNEIANNVIFDVSK